MKLEPHHPSCRSAARPPAGCRRRPAWLLFAASACLAAASAAHAQSTHLPPSADPNLPPAGNGIGYGVTTSHLAYAGGLRDLRADASAATAGPRATATETAGGYSLLPYTRNGYVGINLGRANFDTRCGSGPYECDDPEVSGYFYTGGLLNPWLGLELGYLHTGRAERSGGHTRAQGLNLSVLLRAPVGSFNVFAKGGALYGQTRVSAGLLSDVPTGRRSGWGSSYGFGVGYDFTPSAGVVLEWSRHRFLFPGTGRQSVDNTSLGFIHRF